MSDTILRLAEVKRRTGLGRSTIYAYQQAGAFPKPIQLGARSVGWLERDVQAWIEGKIAKSRPG